ncbi:MAG: hypothetical protein HZC52_04280, partial [Planctomycetes bacterium]|nr:hypothetical protein [Planctomycetota bacterium]
NTTRDEFKGIPFAIGSHTIRLIVPQNDFLNGKYYASVYLGDDIPMITYSKIEYGLSYSVQTPKNKNGLPIAEGMFNSKHYWEVVDQK